MSEVRLNIRDSSRVIHGEVHGGVADKMVAALSAEPETIDELEAAFERFSKPGDDYKPFSLFHEEWNEEPWDAGIVIIDLVGRVVASDSSYSSPEAQGQILYPDRSRDDEEIWLLYRIPADWRFVYSVPEYKGCQKAREDERLTRRAIEELDARQVLYGDPMIEFVVLRCLAAHKDKAEDPIAEIHADWLMTPRADLAGQTPREVLLAKQDFIDFDLHTREMQWSFVREGPPPLSRESYAYRFAGFGTHEWVIYYDLLRVLLGACWERIQTGEQIEAPAEAARLQAIACAWLDGPQEEFSGRIPAAMLESERRRIPLAMSAKSMIVDENCELCQMIGDEERFGPGFWHLDGCNMDECFVFSSHRTLAEWEEEQQQWREFNEEFEREQAERKALGLDATDEWIDDGASEEGDEYGDEDIPF